MVHLSRLQFNLEVEEVQSAVRELEPWRRQITVPLVIEVRIAHMVTRTNRPYVIQDAASEQH